MAKRKINLCVIFSLCLFLLVGFGSSDQSQNSDSNSNQTSIEALELKLSLILRRLETVEKGKEELEKSHEELKQQFRSSKKKCDEQFKSLKKELDQLKTENCVGEDVWLLRPPIRGRRGEKGEKGDSGRNGNPGQKGERGATGRTGVKGQGFPDPKLITSCSAAMTLLPFAPQRLSIYPHGNTNSKRVEVLCDFETDGGGWTVIQKRTSGPKEQFKQNWTEYQSGFGSVDGNFWLGLDNIHTLTKNGDQELRIDLEDFQGNKEYAKYSFFSISDASDFYRLTFAGFSGDSTLPDDMAYQNGSKFSTIDKDNDQLSINCAVVDGGGGGWWFHRCTNSNLNGLYFEEAETVPWQQGIFWRSWKGPEYSMAKTEMKIRPRE